MVIWLVILAIMILIEAVTMGSVSYTHLDVYKRQVSGIIDVAESKKSG